MKKVFVAGLFAIGLLAIADQHASAWVNSRFGVGLNWDWQSGGNQFLWGAWRNGQPPGPEAFGAGPYGGGGGQRFGAPGPFFGGAPQGYPAEGFPPMPYATQGSAPMPQPAPMQGSFNVQTSEPPYAGTYSSPYQFANYPRPSYYYYYPTTPYYYYGR